MIDLSVDIDQSRGAGVANTGTASNSILRGRSSDSSSSESSIKLVNNSKFRLSQATDVTVDVNTTPSSRDGSFHRNDKPIKQSIASSGIKSKKDAAVRATSVSRVLDSSNIENSFSQSNMSSNGSSTSLSISPIGRDIQSQSSVTPRSAITRNGATSKKSQSDNHFSDVFQGQLDASNQAVEDLMKLSATIKESLESLGTDSSLKSDLKSAIVPSDHSADRKGSSMTTFDKRKLSSTIPAASNVVNDENNAAEVIVNEKKPVNRPASKQKLDPSSSSATLTSNSSVHPTHITPSLSESILQKGLTEEILFKYGWRKEVSKTYLSKEIFERFRSNEIGEYIYIPPWGVRAEFSKEERDFLWKCSAKAKLHFFKSLHHCALAIDKYCQGKLGRWPDSRVPILRRPKLYSDINLNRLSTGNASNNITGSLNDEYIPLTIGSNHNISESSINAYSKSDQDQVTALGETNLSSETANNTVNTSMISLAEVSSDHDSNSQHPIARTVDGLDGQMDESGQNVVDETDMDNGNPSTSTNSKKDSPQKIKDFNFNYYEKPQRKRKSFQRFGEAGVRHDFE